MVRKFEKHQQRLQALSLLGKDLARRARSKCELCGASGSGFVTYEVEPVPEEPVLTHCLLLCQECNAQLDQRKAMDPHYWRCLDAAAWSELTPVQVTAVRILRQVDAGWARDMLEDLYVFPDAEALL